MNISLDGVVNKKRKRGAAPLAFGLNSRNKKIPTKTSSSNSVFGEDGDSSDNESDEDNADRKMSSRDVINKQIAREQAAKRRRAKADLASVKDKSVFDYDGAYDSFQKQEADAAKEEKAKDQEKKSKYIGDLLKAAKARERERDAIYERKNAREQAEEDAKSDFRGKEKFVTNAYKRKLQERQQWEAEQEQKERDEAANDITKKSAGTAFSGFYGNLNRSTMMEHKKSEEVEHDDNKVDQIEECEKHVDTKLPDDDDVFDPRQGLLGGFERSSLDADDGNIEVDGKSADQLEDEDSDKVPPPPTLTNRERREKKLAEARIRYLQRKQARELDQ